MIVTFVSVGGSPGVTSWSLLIAAAWPSDTGRERVVFEADLDGGVLGARYGLGVDPGVVSLIAALRRDDEIPVAEHGRAAGGGVWLVPGPESAEQARVVWTGTADGAAARLAADERLWLVDGGRLHVGSSTLPFIARSAITLVLCRSHPEDLVQVPARVAALRRDAPVGVLVVGKAAYGTDELGEFFGTPVVWTVAASNDLTAIAGAVLVPGRARRTWLWRSALEVAAGVAALAIDGPPAGAPPPSGQSQPVEVFT
jgi:MinD-like ATPase involved in chromosome partitioning or flagellar assembly